MGRAACVVAFVTLCYTNWALSAPTHTSTSLPKLNVVLDIDETLIHVRRKSFRRAHEKPAVKAAAPIKGVKSFLLKMLDGETATVNKRPEIMD